jgi:RNA polymerase sigma-70 factor (ECF subfamily)
MSYRPDIGCGSAVASVASIDPTARIELRTRPVKGTIEVDLERTIHQHHQHFRRFAYRLVGSEVDDVLQTAYLKALTAAESFDRHGGGDPTRWLYRIIYRCAIDDLRRQKRQQRPLTDVDYLVADKQPPPDERLDIAGALRLLSPEHRAVLLLVDQIGYSYREASHILQIRQGTVASRLNHSRRMIRAALMAAEESSGGG